MTSDILSFTLLAAILVLIPGLDFTLVLRYATTKGRKSAIMVMLGITSSLFIWGTFAALGISAVLETSKIAFETLKILGVAYMFWMGANFIHSAFMKESIAESTPEIRVERGAYLRGILSNLLNPKAGVFYISVLPQFIPDNSNHLLMGIALTGIHASLTIIFFITLIFFVDAVKSFFLHKKVARLMEALSGVAVIGFGTKLLLSHN
jgi:threonine/homoserine/homoserine lactone efflux protein